jgi:glycosyltransferase-like protein LARGE
LRAQKVWWSSKAPANAMLTVATVTTLDRLYQLEAQCSSWAGPLSAVVYVPINKQQDQSSDAAEKAQLADAERQVMKLVTR